jgi:hypothetical protein
MSSLNNNNNKYNLDEISKEFDPIIKFIKEIKINEEQETEYGIFGKYIDIINLIQNNSKNNSKKNINLIINFNSEQVELFDELCEIIDIIIYQGEGTNSVFIFPVDETLNLIKVQLEGNIKNNNNRNKKNTIMDILLINQKLFSIYYLSLGQIANLIYLELKFNPDNKSFNFELNSIEEFLEKIEKITKLDGTNDEKNSLTNKLQNKYIKYKKSLFKKILGTEYNKLK